jgi:hypothetical protein
MSLCNNRSKLARNSLEPDHAALPLTDSMQSRISLKQHLCDRGPLHLGFGCSWQNLWNLRAGRDSHVNTRQSELRVIVRRRLQLCANTVRNLESPATLLHLHVLHTVVGKESAADVMAEAIHASLAMPCHSHCLIRTLRPCACADEMQARCR